MPITSVSQGEQTTEHRPGGDDFFVRSELVLSDGRRFAGMSPKWQSGTYPGEVVFNTGMTGYVESLTDPSYSNEILVFTYPLIGNYGALAEEAWESEKTHVAGVVVSEASINWSHSGADTSLLEWLEAQGVPVLIGVDTRALTRHLRVQGTMMGAIGGAPSPDLKPETKHVSIDEPEMLGRGGSKRVVAVDCGMKNGILRSLLEMGLEVVRVPRDYDYSEKEFDGVLLSNGPGDPSDYPETVEITKKVMQLGKPIFGICLGNQIMGLAAGGSTYKLKFGHRGHNQPCMDPDKACVITSQNHGFAVDAASLPSGWRILYKNLNDDSVEGIEHESKPWFAVQFHPEAKPGPTDTHNLFKRFCDSL